MTTENVEPTRSMDAQDTMDRTIAQPADPALSTGSDATQMGVMVTCPVCRTSNPGLETYCSECGFLLASEPGAEADVEQKQASRFCLVEDRAGRRLPLHDGDNLIGREGADVLLMDSTVSRRHAILTIVDNAVSLADQGSTNGTQVDGVRAAPGVSTPVKVGSVIQLGHVSLRLEGPDGGSVASEPTVAIDASAPEVEAQRPEDLDRRDVACLRTDASPEGDIVIRSGRNLVGRRADNDIVIKDDPFVSGRHAVFEAAAGTVSIADLGSTNGTFVNGQRLAANAPLVLDEGDEVGMGKGRYRFEQLEDAWMSDEAAADGDPGEPDEDLAETGDPDLDIEDMLVEPDR